jgi:hypothetical protein
MTEYDYDVRKFDLACRKFGATPDDMRRLIVLAAQRNHVLVAKLRLGSLTEYGKRVASSVSALEEEAYLPGQCSTRDLAMRRAEQIRRNIVLQGPISPDSRRPA